MSVFKEEITLVNLRDAGNARDGFIPESEVRRLTEQQIERDVRGLLSGAKEGRVTIENENPDTTGGRRRVVDEVHPADVRTEATGYVRADHLAEP